MNVTHASFRTTLRVAACVPLIALLTACGAWQSVTSTTADLTRAVFVAKIKQMNLVIASRSALNQDGRGESLPVVLLSEPMFDDAQFVGVVAFFRDQANAEWQLVIPKAQWKKTDPVKLSVADNRIELEAAH
jgi:type VI secretion system protein VasD